MNQSERGISRRDFLKVGGLALGALTLRPDLWPVVSPETGQEQCEQKQSADRITAWMYPYPSFDEAETSLPKHILESQLGYVRSAGYRCLTDKKFAQFLRDGGSWNPLSIVLGFRVDEDRNIETDVAIWNVWRDGVIPLLLKYGLHGIWFIKPSAIESIPDGLTWEDLAKWNKKGIISIGSCGMSRLDMSESNPETIYAEARGSKVQVEKALRDAGSTTSVIGFAYPLERIPENTEKIWMAGYQFALGRRVGKEGENSAMLADSMPLSLPTLSPLVENEWFGISSTMPGYGYPVLGSRYSKDGHRSFNEVLAAEGTQITIESTPSALPVEMAPPDLLPDGLFRNQLMRPTMIIIHTDDQSMTQWEYWNAHRTKNALFAMNKAVHFATDSNGSLQLSKAWQNPCERQVLFPMIDFVPWPPRGGAAHLNACALSIELAGSGYNRYFDQDAPDELKSIIYVTAKHASNLTVHLLEVLGLGIENVFGHYQVSLRGKTDPGERFMNELFIPLVQEKLKKPQVSTPNQPVENARES